MSFSNNVIEQAQRIGIALSNLGWTLTAAESCTGGLYCGAITSVPGSSAWFRQGLVTYSNEAKTGWVGVPEEVLRQHGAVSQATVQAMAEGAVVATGAELAVSISGIAGPDGAVAGKPVGTVWIGIAAPKRPVSAACHHFDGDRQSVRSQAVEAALRATLDVVERSDRI